MLTLVALMKIIISYSPAVIGYETRDVIFVKSGPWKSLLLNWSKHLLETKTPLRVIGLMIDNDGNDDDSMSALRLQE